MGIRITAGALALGVLAHATAAHAQATAPIERTFSHAGAARSYLAYLPSSARSRDAPPPVLIVLHGGGGNAGQVMAFARFNPIAAREGLVALYPQGLDRGWNDGREFSGRDTRKDDVGFLLAVLDDIERQGTRIDRAAVGVTGISNGGFMSMRMACDAADRISGIAAVTATLPATTGERCRPARPVPVLVINGTHDPLVPYDGGEVRLFGRGRGVVWSTSRTMQFWAKVNGCDGAPQSAALADREPEDGTLTVRHDYPGCSRAPAVLLEVQGGGHTWPGARQYLPSFLIGPTSRDFDASETIVEFFMSVWRRTAR